MSGVAERAGVAWELIPRLDGSFVEAGPVWVEAGSGLVVKGKAPVEAAGASAVGSSAVFLSATGWVAVAGVTGAAQPANKTKIEMSDMTWIREVDFILFMRHPSPDGVQRLQGSQIADSPTAFHRLGVIEVVGTHRQVCAVL